jgi:hypothetical protein
MHGLSIERDFASSGRCAPARIFINVLFARAVLSNQSVDLPRPYREIHALERAHAGKTLSYPGTVRIG